MSAALENAGFEIVGSAENALAGVQVAKEQQPDLVILDVLMPGLSGLEVVDKLYAAAPNTKVVLLTASESEEDLLKAIKVGSAGYIVKTTPLPELVTAMQNVMAGGAVVSPAMGMKLFETVAQMLRHRDVVVGRKPALTGREIEVLQAVAEGRTSREIGEILFISENTVKNHVRNILDKLGLHSRGEAVMYALREDLIRID
jgi:two-component system NarL family response regulator